MKTIKSRPLVRYHGGKWLLAPWIISHFPPHRCYVEPFGGGGSVLLRKPRAYCEVYNDLSEEMVNLFRVVRDDGERLAMLCELTPFARKEFTESYKGSPTTLERARCTLIKSFMGFGSNSILKKSGFRANSNRSGTTPAQDWMNYPDALRATIQRLRGVVIEHRDAIECMEQHDTPQTLHYADPPYVFRTRSDNGHDYEYEMTDSDHAQFIEKMKSLKGMVIISGYRCDAYDEALKEWRRIDKNSLSDGAKKRVESLWLSPNTLAPQIEINECL